jgi:hypothetical protein
MFDVQTINSSVKIGSRKTMTMTATKIGKKRMTVMQKDGATQDVVLTSVKLCTGTMVKSIFHWKSFTKRI